MEDFPSAEAGVIGALTGVVQDDVLSWNTQTNSIFFHGGRFIVINDLVVAAHQQFFDFAMEVQFSRCANAISQDRSR